VVRHPEFASIIEQAVDSVEFVSTRLSFDYWIVTIGLPEALPPEDIERLETKIGSMSEQMFYEISVAAHQFIEQSLLGKDQVTRNALRPIRRMRDKLDGLGFLDYRVAPVVDTIDDLLARIPDKGAIAGSILQEILATALLLADPDKTRRHGEGLLAAQDLPKAEIVEDEVSELPVNESLTVLAVPTPALETSLPVDGRLDAKGDDSVQNPAGFSGLFDGIFDDDGEGDDDAGKWAIDVMFAQNNAALPNHALSPSKRDDEAELEVVTATEDTEKKSDQDYWF
jgi:hypothetical protein